MTDQSTPTQAQLVKANAKLLEQQDDWRTEMKAIGAEVEHLVRERDEAVRRRDEKSRQSDAAFGARSLRIDGLEAELERQRPVLEAAKAVNTAAPGSARHDALFALSRAIDEYVAGTPATEED